MTDEFGYKEQLPRRCCGSCVHCRRLHNSAICDRVGMGCYDPCRDNDVQLCGICGKFFPCDAARVYAASRSLEEARFRIIAQGIDMTDVDSSEFDRSFKTRSATKQMLAYRDAILHSGCIDLTPEPVTARFDKYAGYTVYMHAEDYDSVYEWIHENADMYELWKNSVNRPKFDFDKLMFA